MWGTSWPDKNIDNDTLELRHKGLQIVLLKDIWRVQERIEDGVDAVIQELQENMRNNKEWLIATTKNFKNNWNKQENKNYNIEK